MRRPLWLLVLLLLTACAAPSVTINVNPGAVPTATSAVAATASVAVAHRASQAPEVVHLPHGPTPTPQRPGAQAALVAPAVAPTAIARTPAPYKPAAIGQPVGAWGWRFLCTGAESPQDGLIWSAAGNRLVPVGSWVVVALDLTNTQVEPQAVGAEEFVIHDGRQRSYAPTGALGAADYSAFRGGQRFGEPVPPGATVRYYLAFDVAADARDLRLVLASRPVSNGFIVSFDLGR